MLIKSLVTGAALALAVSVGSAFAAEDFSATSAVPAAPLTASEMAAITGAYVGNTSHNTPGVHRGLTEVVCVRLGHAE